MKNRMPWMIAGAIVLLGIAIFHSVTREPSGGKRAAPLTRTELPPPPPVDATTALPTPTPTVTTVRPVVSRPTANTIDVTTIRDGATIDLSSGRPVVTKDKTDKEIIDRALREMEEAAKSVSFSDPAATPAAPKK
jgi:hypothetical protein